MRSTHSQRAGAGRFDPPVSNRDHPSFVRGIRSGQWLAPSPFGGNRLYHL